AHRVRPGAAAPAPPPAPAARRRSAGRPRTPGPRATRAPRPSPGTPGEFRYHEAVPDAAHRLDERRPDLAAQGGDVHLDDVRTRVAGQPPHEIEQLGAGQHESPVP